MKISIQNLQLKYGDFVAIENLNLDIGDGEALVLLGQSGCGKTSTMRCLAGLEEPSSGRIIIDDVVVFDSEKGINLPPNKRNVGMVFQSYAVWPHMTVFQNVAYSLKLQRLSKAETQDRVMEVLTMVGLEKFADRGASLLSGGQMQRVALARSLVMRPSVLMLDEPLSNLDARLRDRLRVELREIQLRLGLTCVYVTHDQHEAFALADRIALLQGGKIVQIGGPREMYETPASASIAHFLGVSNVMDCESVPAPDGSATAKVAGHGLTIHSAQRAATAPQHMKVCMRAEDLQISSRPTTAPNAWQGKVMVAGFQGNDVRYAVELEGGLELDALGTIKRGEQHEVGDSVWVSIDPSQVQILPAEVLV
ncbi:ABC transporter ATP-binding protein [Arthrobacter sp. UKPF54-2]|uniref:ABC transporter ATP-binding protein n=1 Tax=Arthrobacter sp. UKPF54-2 TaxID=2600159 RepID=UPI0011B11D3A|nr:ABC transporter ATP-binding protein [Arthrobacter sp. UKPF54-2]QDY90013.1 ABC transporter ATP-binding protein [Arthrobacter sp. UKPF54-2]